MNETRKKIILNEVRYWKANRLLPAQYCDYLLTLYSGESQPAGREGKAGFLGKPFGAAAAVLSVALTLYVNYFTELDLNLQMLLAVIFILMSAAAVFVLKKDKILFQSALVLTAFNILLLTVKILDAAAPGSRTAYFIVLGLHCAGWMAAGWKFKIKSFMFGSIIGTLLLIYFLVKML
ncbi:hypothetical protein V1498_06430 [Peribacillus sp. SCS-26]|uniref:hypothetical protein n=1 Tax=Paraperibacillus marinus TaxID=3115295 RepID=UPI003906521B